MPNQFTRRQIFNTLLIGTLAVGIGSFNLQPSDAQLNRSNFRQTARELDLSRSQMRQVAGIVRSFKSDIKDILTPEQFERFRSAQKQQSKIQRQELKELLALSDTQAAQLASAREEMIADLEGVLTPSQFTRIVSRMGLNRF